MKLLVIGANSGIGAAVAEAGLSAGYDRVLSVGKEAMDVRKWESIRNFFNRRLHHLPFDHVVYCPGVAQLTWIHELDQRAVVDLFQVNLVGFLGVLRELTALQSKGRILALVSDAARIPMRTSIAYCSSKAGLEMAIRCAARELAPRWQVNGLAPGAVRGTAMSNYVDEEVSRVRGWTLEYAQEYERKTIPAGRRCEVSEVVNMVFRLLGSPEYLSGHTTYMTGGR